MSVDASNLYTSCYLHEFCDSGVKNIEYYNARCKQFCTHLTIKTAIWGVYHVTFALYRSPIAGTLITNLPLQITPYKLDDKTGVANQPYKQIVTSILSVQLTPSGL